MAAREKKVDETSYEVSGSVKVLGGLTLFVLCYLFWRLTLLCSLFYVYWKAFYGRLLLFVKGIIFNFMICVVCLHVTYLFTLYHAVSHFCFVFKIFPSSTLSFVFLFIFVIFNLLFVCLPFFISSFPFILLSHSSSFSSLSPSHPPSFLFLLIYIYFFFYQIWKTIILFL